MNPTQSIASTYSGGQTSVDPASPSDVDAAIAFRRQVRLAEATLNFARKNFARYQKSQNPKFLKAAWDNAWKVLKDGSGQTKAEARSILPPLLLAKANEEFSGYKKSRSVTQLDTALSYAVNAKNKGSKHIQRQAIALAASINEERAITKFWQYANETKDLKILETACESIREAIENGPDPLPHMTIFYSTAIELERATRKAAAYKANPQNHTLREEALDSATRVLKHDHSEIVTAEVNKLIAGI